MALNILPPGHPHARQQKRAGTPKRKRKKTASRPWWLWVVITSGALVVVYVAAAAAVFFAVKWHWTDELGVVDPLAQAYNRLNDDAATISLPNVIDRSEAETRAANRLIDCRLEVLSRAAPRNAVLIQSAQDAGVNNAALTKMIFAADLRLPLDSVAAQAIDDCAVDSYLPGQLATVTNDSLFPWANAEEWSTVREALIKDRDVIDRVSRETGVSSRTIVSVAIVEQLRLYYTQRELFEKFFRPLKILGNATQFAWGVMAIKEKTAIEIERFANSPRSSMYPGPGYAKLLALPAKDPDKVRFERLTNEKDHYYSYLYGAAELKEFIAQWQRAGFPVDDRPEILATLFNIGLSRSRPSADPKVGGSTLKIAETEYTFGSLAFEWYYSGEILDVFPFPMTNGGATKNTI